MPQAAGMYYFAANEDAWSRPAVIFIHGAGGNNLYWPAEVRRLSGQRLYVLDLPGHGKSEGIGRQAVADYARCVLDFMDELKLRKAIFIGHSMGGAIALELALSYGRRTLGIGLISAGSRLRVAPDLLEKTATQATFPLAIQAINEWAFSPQADPRLKELSLKRMAEIRAPVLHGDFLACNAFDLTPRLGRVRVPTLIVCGTQDKMTPLHNSEMLHSRIKNSLFHTIEGAGHMVMLENPVAVATYLQLFLDAITYQPGSRDEG